MPHVTGSRPRHRPRRAALVALLALGLSVLATAVAGARIAPLPGTHRPGIVVGSQIVKYSGDQVRCLVIDIDNRALRWAYVRFDATVRGCRRGAFNGFAIVHEDRPRSVHTVGLAWRPVYEASSPRCPVPKVPAAVARVFRICRGSSARRASAASAPLLGGGRAAPHARGFGTVRPATVFLGGDPTGLFTHLNWHAWGRRRSTAVGKGYYPPPGEPVAAAVRVPVILIASSLGQCRGHLAYRRLRVTFIYRGHARPGTSLGICGP